jgi:hypothetical protein
MELHIFTFLKKYLYDFESGSASPDPTESRSGIRIRNRGSSQRNNKIAPGLNENTVTELASVTEARQWRRNSFFSYVLYDLRFSSKSTKALNKYFTIPSTEI